MTSVPIKSDLDEFSNVFPSNNPVSPARRLMILHRTQQSTLFDIRMTDLHRCPVWQAYATCLCLACIECTRFFC